MTREMKPHAMVGNCSMYTVRAEMGHKVWISMLVLALTTVSSLQFSVVKPSHGDSVATSDDSTRHSSIELRSGENYRTWRMSHGSTGGRALPLLLVFSNSAGKPISRSRKKDSLVLLDCTKCIDARGFSLKRVGKLGMQNKYIKLRDKQIQLHVLYKLPR